MTGRDTNEWLAVLKYSEVNRPCLHFSSYCFFLTDAKQTWIALLAYAYTLRPMSPHLHAGKCETYTITIQIYYRCNYNIFREHADDDGTDDDAHDDTDDDDDDGWTPVARLKAPRSCVHAALF